MSKLSELTASSALDTDSAGGRENSVQIIVKFLDGIETCLVVCILGDPVQGFEARVRGAAGSGGQGFRFIINYHFEGPRFFRS